jgi:Uma2 family endonuclease
MATATFAEQATQPLAFIPAAPADTLYEVVDGQVVEVAVGALQVFIAGELHAILSAFAKKAAVGRVVTEMLFDLALPSGRKRRPDVAFVSYRRWPRDRAVPDTEAWEVVPDLAVEVVSRTNLVEDVVAKMKDYFRAGVSRVWVVLPVAQEVCVYDAPNQVTIVTRAESLAGDPILPGFTLPLSLLFETPAPESG